uniref:Putative secreted protein n=2 Tax=Anopheles triannulatus TaxID=58253 RepID=A0A2M4A7H9_9DIPT
MKMKYLVVLLLLGLLAYASVAGAPVPEESKEEATTAASGDTTDAAVNGEKPANGAPADFLQTIIRNAMDSLPPNVKDRLQVVGLNF